MIKDIPGLTKRRAETEVNLRENETLVIAGLVTDDMSRNVDKVPALGDVPILGKLFRSKQFREQQTELVVMITPRFVSGEMGAAGESFAAVKAQPAPIVKRAADGSHVPASDGANDSTLTTVEATRRKLKALRESIEMQE